MTNPFVKHVGQTAAETAQKIAKQMVHESFEVVKSVGNQAVGKESGVPDQETGSAQVESVVEKIDEAAVKANDISRLSALESQVRSLIAERAQQQQEWHQKLNTEMGLGKDPNEAENKKILVQPTTKKKRGFAGGTKGKQGTKEVSKSPSG